ncbi:ABC transporter ATP-binding protein [Crateriforma conspicua]|uniref:Putative ABC transporter ATP-binding protein YxlF n=1 Tax=Crateriforma conspicua TaxID=2527996 RepID=A0A5C5Y5G0_9PLAN|nr:ABC transporter ATP-binding protein [Crateriforma conspicua]TWT70460.1 putative ABC transporter ATP-binding protein YxlF [Crateriforma conspicua]
MTSESHVVSIDGLTKRYREVVALDDVTLKIRPGVTGLLGPNGSGKSTFIKALLGLVRTQTGAGDVMGLQWPEQVRAIRDAIGYSPEDDCYIAGLTGIESVALMAELSGLPRIEALRRSHEILDFCDVGEERYREVESYSTGMRQKLKFAQALVHDPDLLILDEPTTGLDPKQRRSMLDRIRTLGQRHGKSILLSTHILHDVRAVCDHVIILVGGTVRVSDSLANLSRPAEPSVQVGVQGDPSLLVRDLQNAGHEVSATIDGRWKVGGIDPNDSAAIWQTAGQSGAAISRLEPARNSLEQIFFAATGATMPIDAEPGSVDFAATVSGQGTTTKGTGGSDGAS